MAQYKTGFPAPQAPEGATRAYDDSDSVQLTPESQQKLDTGAPDLQSPSGKKSSSLMSKIKDKTSKLKTKVKKELHTRSSDKDSTGGTTDRGLGHDSSSSSSSEDESEAAASQKEYAQLPKHHGDPVAENFSVTSNPAGLQSDATAPAVHGGDSFPRAVSGQEGLTSERAVPDPAAPAVGDRAWQVSESSVQGDGDSSKFISPFRNDGPEDALQAVPTQYFYGAASLPSEEDTRTRQETVPAVEGQESAGISRDLGGLSGQQVPHTLLHDSATEGPFSSDQHEFKGRAAAERDDLPFTERLKEAAAAAGSAETAKHHIGGEEYQGEEKPLTERATEGIYNAKDRLVGAVAGSTGAVTGSTGAESGVDEQKPFTERATEGIYNAKDRVVGAVSGETPAAEEQKPFTERATEGIYNAKDRVVGAVSGNTPAADEQKPFTERASEGIYNVKDKVVGAVTGNTGTETESGTTGLTAASGEEQKPYTERAKEGLNYAKEAAVGTLYGTKDKAADATTESSEAARESTGSATEGGKTWTEKAKETLGAVTGKIGYGAGAQDTSATTTATADQKPVTQRVQESAYAAKDAIASKLGYSSSPKPVTEETELPASLADSLPGTQTGTGTGAVTGTGTSTGTEVGGDAVPFTQKVSQGVGQAKGYVVSTKDAAADRFHPDEHDKALSQKITDTLGGLSLGGSSPRSPARPSDPDSKGIVGRISESVTSLFSKKPASGAEEQDVPTSEVAEGLKQIGEGQAVADDTPTLAR